MKKAQRGVVKGLPKKKIDILFDEYAQYHQNPSGKWIHWIGVPLMFFSIMGLAWSIPFPHLAFLGKYNGFVNWASFLIAFLGYYYYRLSPVLSYMAILLFFVMALIVTELEKWAFAGGPALWLVCTVAFVLALIAQFVTYKMEGKKPEGLQHLKFILIGPVWLLQQLGQKLGLKSN